MHVPAAPPCTRTSRPPPRHSTQHWPAAACPDSCHTPPPPPPRAHRRADTRRALQERGEVFCIEDNEALAGELGDWVDGCFEACETSAYGNASNIYDFAWGHGAALADLYTLNPGLQSGANFAPSDELAIPCYSDKPTLTALGASASLSLGGGGARWQRAWRPTRQPLSMGASSRAGTAQHG